MCERFLVGGQQCKHFKGLKWPLDKGVILLTRNWILVRSESKLNGQMNDIFAHFGSFLYFYLQIHACTVYNHTFNPNLVDIIYKVGDCKVKIIAGDLKNIIWIWICGVQLQRNPFKAINLCRNETSIECLYFVTQVKSIFWLNRFNFSKCVCLPAIN